MKGLHRLAWFSARRASIILSGVARRADRALYGLLTASFSVYLFCALLINVALDRVMVQDRAGLARTDWAQAAVTATEWARVIGSFAAVATLILLFIAVFREWRNYSHWRSALRMKPHLDALNARAKGI